MSKKQQKVKFPISMKLVGIFTTLVILVLGVTTYMVSTLVRSDERAKAEENNHTINGRTAETVQDKFLTEQHNAAGLLNTLVIIPGAEAENYPTDLFNDYCLRNKETVFLYGPGIGLKCNNDFTSKINNLYAISNDWIQQTIPSLNASKKDSVEVRNISSLYGIPITCILFPYKNQNVTEYAAVAFKADYLSEVMSTGSLNSTFLVDKTGNVLIHSDFKRMISADKTSELPAIKDMIHSTQDNSQGIFPDENGENCFYAYHKIAGSMFVVTTQSQTSVFESIDRTTYRIVLFSLAIMFLALFTIRMFSKSITHPIGELVDASRQIEIGNFDLDIKPHTQDEIGLLTGSFSQMSRGLAERERLMDTFSRFTNKTIAERARKGELALGGETRNVTVFFSDIRSFTAMSEKLTPHQVVDMLNVYMTRMVDCVKQTGGNVDKYIGDAIMAVWGAPDSAGSPALDAWNAVQTALLMRNALYLLNKERIVAGKPAIKIGCGINSGDVVAGQIGSNERMEYTVIGDTVNFASRTEALNKPFATDILITENTYILLKDKVNVEEMPSVTVKGKEKPVKIFAVISSKEDDQFPKDIEELRAFLGVKTPDFTKVNADAEEKKYNIN